jgi:signal transduction histidine kinase/DNA-binding response OmpR family regulator
MILIVDDRPENIFSLKSILELHDFKVDTADSGELALKKILRNSYSLIILDIQMPGMDGFEVAEAISGFSKAKDTPIIFLSAVNKDKAFVTKGYSSGGVDYVTKPVDPDILLLKVKTFYKLSEQRRELMRAQDSLRKEVEARKLAQSELKQRMTELHSVLESLPQIAFTVHKDGQIEYVNEQWYSYSDHAETLPRMHPDDHVVHEEWKDAFSAGTEFIREVRMKKNGSDDYRYYLLKVTPVIQNNSLIKWVGTFTDIHRQKVVSEELEQKVNERTRELSEKNEELETRNHELQQFAWVASHDLKEPLRKIQTFNSLISEKYMSGNKDALPYLERSIRSSQRMLNLIDNLLQYSRLSVAALFEPINLYTFLRDIITDLELSISDKRATINLGDMPVVEGIPGQLRQVFQNLISNALKFSREGVPPVVHIHAELVADKSIDSPADPNGHFCRITVSDNGIGFDEKYLDRIFVIFQRLHTREKYEGTGIGLAITKKIIDKHNGIITASSSENQGSTFIMVLPLKQQSSTVSS